MRHKQEKVAKLLGLGLSTYGKLERGANVVHEVETLGLADQYVATANEVLQLIDAGQLSRSDPAKIDAFFEKRLRGTTVDS